MKIIVPMAGRGQRFADLADLVKDYTVPKPMIPVFEKPMVRWAIESFRSFLQLNESDTERPLNCSDLVFICLREHDEKFAIADFLYGCFSRDVRIVLIDKVTRGPAETALLAEKFMDPDEDIIVSDCDHHFDAAPLWEAIKDSRDSDVYSGILPIIMPPDKKPSWSYVVLNDAGEIIDIREKDAELARRGAYGVIGAYYFKRSKDFITGAREMIDENDRVGTAHKEEFYMSRIYQRMLMSGKRFDAALINTAFILGTPEQLQRFMEAEKKKRCHG